MTAAINRVAFCIDSNVRHEQQPEADEACLETCRSMEELCDGDMAVEKSSDRRQKLVHWNALRAASGDDQG